MYLQFNGHEERLKTMPPSEELFQIKGLHFCAGIVIKNNKVISQASILKYMRGWSQAEVQRYCDNKRWDFTKVDTSNDLPVLLR